MLLLNMLLLSDEGVSIIFGMDIDSLIIILTSILAVILFVIALLSFRRNRRERFLFVTGAFFLFAVKGFLLVLSDNVKSGSVWMDSAAHLLDLGILLLFFFGLIKK